MPTTAIGRGRVASAAFVDEATFGVPPVSGFTKFSFYKENIRETFGLQSDPLLGQNPNNARDQVAPAPSLPEHGGSIDIPVCWNQLGLWLKMLFGAPVTTGAADKTHVFASGAATLPTRTIEIQKLAADFRQHVGVAANGFSWEFEDANGFHMAKVDVIGRGENLLTATAAGAPATVALDQIAKTRGVVRVNGVQAGFVRQGKFEYRNGLAAERYVDDTGRAAAIVINADAEAMGELRIRHNSQAFDTLAQNLTEQSVEIEFQKTATVSLLIAMPACRFERPSTPIEGPGGLEQTVPFRAHQGAGGPMVTVTLKNQIASY